MSVPVKLIELVKKFFPKDKLMINNIISNKTDEIRKAVKNMNKSKDNYGRSILKIAIEKKKTEVVEWLIKSGIEINNEFPTAAHYENKKIVTLLLNEGCRISERKSHGLLGHSYNTLDFTEFVYDELNTRGKSDYFAYDLIITDNCQLIRLLLNKKYRFRGKVYEKWLYKAMSNPTLQPDDWKQRAQELIDEKMITFVENKKISEYQWWKLCVEMENDTSDGKWLFDNIKSRLNINALSVIGYSVANRLMTSYALEEFYREGLKFYDDVIFKVLARKIKEGKLSEELEPISPGCYDTFSGIRRRKLLEGFYDGFFQIKFMLEKSDFDINCKDRRDLNIFQQYCKEVFKYEFIPKWQNEFIKLGIEKGMDVDDAYVCESEGCLVRGYCRGHRNFYKAIKNSIEIVRKELDY